MASELVGDTGLSEPSLYQNAPQEDEDDDLAARLPSAMAKRFPAPAAVSAAQLLNHPDFIDFASDSFDANSYASAVVHSPASAYYAAGGNISASLAKLNYNVEHLRKQIHDQVATHYEDLLQQVTGLQDLEDLLASVKAGLGSLDSSMDKIRAKIRTPYTQLSLLTAQLANVQSAADILRRVIRFLYLARRLEAQMAGADGTGEAKERELAKGALTYAELESILSESDLSGIAAVDRLMPMLSTMRTRISEIGDQRLKTGMQTGDQSSLAYGLQVHKNLGKLPATTRETVDALLESCFEQLRSGLDVQAANKDAREGGQAPPVRRAGANEPVASAQAAVWATALWGRLEKAVDGIYNAVAQVYLLERVLGRRKDPISGRTFAEEVGPAFGGEGVVEYMWRNLAAGFDREIKNATKSSVFLLQTLQNAYPRLLRLVKDFFVRVRVIKGQDVVRTAGPADPASNEVEDSEEALFLRSLSPLATAYIQRSATRLFDRINLAFPGGGSRQLSAKDDADRIVRVAAAELEQAKFDAKLLRAVAKNVGKATHAFAVKSEAAVYTYELAPNFASSTASSGLVSNLDILNGLFVFEEGIWRTLEEYEVGTGLLEEIGPNVDAIRKVAMAGVEPLFRAVGKEIEATMSKIHKEDYSRGAQPAKQTAGRTGTPALDSEAAYLKELSLRLKWIQREIVNRLTGPGEETKSWVRALGARTLDLFLRQASLCRPLSEPGKLKLANDMTQIEFLLNQFLVDSGIKNGLNATSAESSDELADAYRHLRAFRPMLFLDLQQLAAPHHTAQIPKLIVAHHLFVRSPSGTLLLPHERFGWTQLQYSEWLDQHSERDQITLVERCLEEYVNDVRKRGEREFTAEYPVARTVCDDWKSLITAGAATTASASESS